LLHECEILAHVIVDIYPVTSFQSSRG
jgi:hypothetical protein